MDTASDLFLVLTHDGRVTHVNRAALALASCERKDVLRDGISRVLLDEDVAFFHSRMVFCCDNNHGWKMRTLDH